MVLSKPDCTTHPEGTPLGPMRFAYAYGNPWKTDFNVRCVPMVEFFSGGPPKDAIPAIDSPRFESVADADSWLLSDEPVLVFTEGDIAHAYPLQILLWHEIVNDVIGDLPLLVTYCPLCHTALMFDRRLEGQVYDFGSTGLLRGSDLVMYDRQTESWWQQLSGQALVGAMSGKTLQFLPAFHTTWAEFKEAYPQGEVLSRDNGYEMSYGTTPYVYYDTQPGPTSDFWSGETDARLPAMARVSLVSIEDSHVAFPFSVLGKTPVVNYKLGNQRIAVFYNADPLSVLNREDVTASRRAGATTVFRAVAQGRELTFDIEDGAIVDRETGSEWSFLGQAVSGPLKGAKLERVIHTDGFWFSWAAFHPSTFVYLGQ